MKWEGILLRVLLFRYNTFIAFTMRVLLFFFRFWSFGGGSLGVAIEILRAQGFWRVLLYDYIVIETSL
jgi:hypothetical protein